MMWAFAKLNHSPDANAAARLRGTCYTHCRRSTAHSLVRCCYSSARCILLFFNARIVCDFNVETNTALWVTIMHYNMCSAGAKQVCIS